MVAHAALAIVAVLALTGGLTAAAATGAFTTSPTGNINLGTLVPGQTGNATATATLHVTNSTTYKLQMEKEDRIGGSFSTFAVSVSVNGQSYNLSSEHSDTHLNLTSGSYTFTIHLSYAVKDHAASANVSKAAFVFLHPIENETVDHESQDNSTNDSSVHYIASEDSGQSQQNNSSRITLFTLTFQVNGVNSSSHEDQNQGTNSSKDSVVVALP